jgi:hypothetical protein
MERKYRYITALKTLLVCVLTCGCLLGLTAVTYAQVKFYTRVDQEVVGRNQPVQLQYVVENANSVQEFKAPAFNDFILIQGPIESSGMSLINGHRTEYKSLVFLLQPKRAGRITIKGARALVDGREMRSNNIVIEVANRNATGPQGSPRGFNFNFPDNDFEVNREFYLRPGENIIEKIKKNLFVKVEVNKTSCYVNEPIVATYKLYSRLRSESRVVKRPSYNGFSVYDMVEPDGSVATTELVDGKEFNVHLIRQSQLFPLQSGTYTLDPVEVENSVRFIKSGDEEANPFDEIFDQGGEIVEETINLSSKSLTIRVNPLPTEKQPAGFDGAVGSFAISTSLSKDTIHAGEMVNLTVKVKGKGNLPIINAPAINWPPGIEGFEPQTDENIHAQTVPLSGEKVFRFPVTAGKTGSLRIPAIHFSYFDPASRSYKSDSTEPLHINVLAALPGQKSVIKSGGAVKPSRNLPETLLLSLVGIVLVVTTVVWITLYRKSEKRKAEAKRILLEQQRLAKAPPHPLLKAGEWLQEGNKLAFLKEMENSIWKKAAEVLSIPRVLLNQPKVVNELNARGASDTANLFREIVNHCEASLYIPGNETENLQEILDKGYELFSKLDAV